jgi:cytochrome c oxidase subunit 3
MVELENETQTLGMWTFLATEVLFFGGLFLPYIVYRTSYPQAFDHAAQALNVTIGTINTAILLTSSYFMALAVDAVRAGKKNQAVRHLLLTAALGFIFLILKAYEYDDDIHKNLLPSAGDLPQVSRLFYFLYYTMTGVHALHLTIGIIAVAVISKRTFQGRYTSEKHAPVELTALYWHFVDVIWIFLYPLLYLIGRHP